jgi:hypothetical protein
MRTLKSIKGIDFLFTLGVLFIASSTIHEYGHLAALRLLGGKGIIDSGVLNGVILIEPTKYQWGNIFVAFMGGWTSAAIFMVLWVLTEDPEAKVSRFCIITYQFIYGQFEGLWYATGNDTLLMVGVVAGIVVMFLVMLKALFRRGVVFRFVTRQKTQANQ